MEAIATSKIIPIQSVEDNYLINGNGDITFGYSVMLPEVFTLSIPESNALHDSLVSLFSRLPSGTVIQKQDFFFLDEYKAQYSTKDSFTQKHNLRHFDGRPMLRHYSNLYFTVSSRMNFSNSGLSNSYTKLADYIFKRPFKDLSKTISTVQSVETTVSNALNGLGNFKVSRMNDDQLLNSLYDFLNLSYDKPITNAEESSLNPYSVDDYSFKVGDKICNVLTLTREGNDLTTLKQPKVASGSVYGNGNSLSSTLKVPASMSYALGLGLPINHILNTTIEILDQQDITNHFKMEQRQLTFPNAFGYEPSQVKDRKITEFINTITEFNYTACKTSVSLILAHENLEVLKNYTAMAQSAFDNMNASNVWREIGFDALNMFMACCPGNAKAIYRTFVQTVPQAVCYLPKETHYRSDRKGNLFVDRFGNPILVDLWEGPYIMNNRNKVIFGPSGTGKSFLINTLIDQSLYNGNHVIVLDVGGSYLKNCSMNEGLYFDAKDKEKLSFNIFLCEKDKEGNYLYMASDDGEGSDDRVNFIYAVIAYIWKEENSPTKEEKTLLKSLIVNFYKYVNTHKIFPTLVEFNNYISIYESSVIDERDKRYMDFRSLQLNLHAYVDGEYKHLLNSKENIQLKDYSYVVFDVEAIQKNKELKNIVSLIIIELVLEKMSSLPLDVRKSFIIDEAIDFLMSGDMADFIAAMYRKIRKKGGEVYLATQDASFLEQCDPLVMKSIVANTEVKILLNHQSVRATYPILQKLLSFTDDDIKILDSLENGNVDGNVYREFFIKINNVSRAFRYEVAPETANVYTTSATELAELNRLFDKYGSMGTAILQHVENKRNKN